MTDFISREAAIDDICSRLDWTNQEGEPFAQESIKAYIKSLIDPIPAADVRPVVLCRDCQNSYEWANVDGDNYRYCGFLRSRWNHNADRIVDDDDFCKWGRKREES